LRGMKCSVGGEVPADHVTCVFDSSRSSTCSFPVLSGLVLRAELNEGKIPRGWLVGWLAAWLAGWLIGWRHLGLGLMFFRKRICRVAKMS
jgi:hypothetical protein